MDGSSDQVCILAQRGDGNNDRGVGGIIDYDDSDGGLGVAVELRCNVNRVMTLQEAAEFCSLFKWGTKWRAFWETAKNTGLRPIELCNLTQHMIITDPNSYVMIDGQRLQHWVGMVYPVGKPKPSGKAGVKSKRKWNRKDERDGHIPPGALLALQTYWYRQGCKPGKLFPKEYKLYGKIFSTYRKKMIKAGYTQWASNENDYFPEGWAKKYPQYDITPYSFRRLHLTCHFWLVSARNGVPNLTSTKKVMAHSNYRETETYVHEAHQAGIPDDQIGAGWGYFLSVCSAKGQTRLNEWWLTDA